MATLKVMLVSTATDGEIQKALSQISDEHAGNEKHRHRKLTGFFVIYAAQKVVPKSGEC